jgi:hypothetical protein
VRRRSRRRWLDRAWGPVALLRGLVDLAIDRRGDVRQILIRRQAFRLQELLHAPQRIAARFCVTLTRRLVQPLIV